MTDYRDHLREWRQADREAWAMYKKYEDDQFPIDPARPFSWPRGMFVARRAFEKEQRIRKAMEMLRLRERYDVRR